MPMSGRGALPAATTGASVAPEKAWLPSNSQTVRPDPIVIPNSPTGNGIETDLAGHDSYLHVVQREEEVLPRNNVASNNSTHAVMNFGFSMATSCGRLRAGGCGLVFLRMCHIDKQTLWEDKT